MKKFLIPAVAAIAVTSAPAFAADLGGKVTKAPAPVVVSPWDIAFGAGVASDYNFRGISQSANSPSVNSYFELRYNSSANLQWYGGIGGYSIALNNRAAAEIDLYGGVRPTFGALALDLGGLYYYYPGGQCFFGGAPLIGVTAAGVASCNPAMPNGNYAKEDISFMEWYAKATYTFNDNFNMGGGVYYADNWLNTGASGTYGNITAKYTGAALANGVGWYLSGELGKYWLGTTDAFFGNANFPNGTPLPDYTTWNVGLGFTYKVFTLDFRYFDTDLSKLECNVLTGDHTAIDTSASIPTNTAGLSSNWCSSAFIVKLSADLTLNSNVK